MAQINVNAFSEALNDKLDRDMQNIDTSSGGDAVIEFQDPTSSNNNTWYRKYASGWVEQGGYMSGSGSGVTVSLPISMLSGNYTVVFGNTSGQYEQVQLTSRGSTSFSAKIANGGGSTTGCWQVSGKSAN